MIEPALLEAILFFVFCLATIIVYEFKWYYVPVIGVIWAFAGAVMTNLILMWYENWYSCISCPWTLMPDYGWFQVWASLNVFVPLIVTGISVWVLDGGRI